MGIKYAVSVTPNFFHAASDLLAFPLLSAYASLFLSIAHLANYLDVYRDLQFFFLQFVLSRYCLPFSLSQPRPLFSFFPFN